MGRYSAAAVSVGASKYGGQETTINAIQDCLFISGMTVFGSGWFETDGGQMGVGAHRPAETDEWAAGGWRRLQSVPCLRHAGASCTKTTDKWYGKDWCAMKTIREQTEAFERQTLSPYAQLVTETKGRMREQEKCALRTEYQRDRDRILHSKSFRRLKHKTQVFITPQGDHYRTRPDPYA